MKVLFLILSTLILSTVYAQENQQRDAEAVGTLLKITRYLAEADLRCATPDDCRILPMGSRACGGPAAFVITSKKNGNMAELEYMATQTEIKQAAYNRNYGVQSICTVLVPPEAKCVSNYCR